MPSVSKTSDLQSPRGESFRVPIDCVVDLRLGPADSWIRTSATNISMSGMFLRTAEMQPRGTALDVKFQLQLGEPPIQAKVEVLWSRVRDTGPETPRGLGVRFLDLDLESKYAISRLVDRYRQLGRTPFHLTAVEGKAKADTADSRHGRGALALAFAAGTATGALASFLWIAEPGGSDETTAHATEVAELKPKSVEQSPLSPEASPPPEANPRPKASSSSVPGTTPAPPGAAVSSDDAADAVEAAVHAWARAWAAKDIERYLAAYLDDFQPASGLSHEAWEAQRRRRLTRPGAIEIRLSALEIDVLAPERAIARFGQAYSAPGYQDQVRKQLELVRHEQGWKIRHEEAAQQQ